MLERLKEIVLDLAARLDLQPTYGWAVVTSLTPLQIRYDAQAEPIAGTPDTLASGLAVGDRVWCMRIHRRDIIIGRARGPERPLIGVVSKETGTLTQIGNTGTWGSQMEIVVPIVLKAGEYIRLTPISIGSGWGSFSQVGLGGGLNSTTVFGRFKQVNSSGAQTLNFVWEVVKPTI